MSNARVPLDTVAIELFTVPDIWKAPGKIHTLSFDRVGAIRAVNGDLGLLVGDDSVCVGSRVITTTESAARKIVDTLRTIIDLERMNCHRFGRIMMGEVANGVPPLVNFKDFEPTESLDEGSVGVIGVEGPLNLPHTLGYGLGEEALQVISANGEFGIVPNSDMIAYWRAVYPGRNARLYQVGSLLQ